ncbi:MAG: hypothetical protein LBL20_01440 [Treponema sp.]|jgi:hypothetical protein|nr:hypothetical protein [Treponema sp.]
MDYKEFCRNRGIPVPGEKAKPKTESQDKAAERLNSLAEQLRTLAEEKGVEVTADMEPEDIIAALRASGEPEDPDEDSDKEPGKETDEVIPDFDNQTKDPAPPAGDAGQNGKKGK